MHTYDQGKVRQAMEREALRDAARKEKSRRREERRRNKIRDRFASLTTDELKFVRNRREQRVEMVITCLAGVSAAVTIGSLLVENIMACVVGFFAVLGAVGAGVVVDLTDCLTRHMDSELRRRAQEINSGDGSCY